LLDVEPGRTYLLRIINAALFAEYYIKIAGHKFTVVAADANYVNPFTTDAIAIAPGETVDALLVADASPGRYYMVALPNQSPLPDPQSPTLTTRGIVQYTSSSKQRRPAASDVVPVSPEMPDQHDMSTSFYFHGNLTSLHDLEVPNKHVDERLFITLGLGSICRGGHTSCKRSENNESMDVATMNNLSYHQPAATTSLLELHYYNTNSILTMLQELPDKPPRVFNYTDPALIRPGPKEAKLEPTSKATIARRFRQGDVVEVVFQGMAILSSETNPMHLHGHDVFVLAQGEGNYDAARDVAKYNLVNPAVKNTVLVPRLGWVAVRFIADNPGAHLSPLNLFEVATKET
jgi:laccase